MKPACCVCMAGVRATEDVGRRFCQGLPLASTRSRGHTCIAPVIYRAAQCPVPSAQAFLHACVRVKLHPRYATQLRPPCPKKKSRRGREEPQPSFSPRWLFLSSAYSSVREKFRRTAQSDQFRGDTISFYSGCNCNSSNRHSTLLRDRCPPPEARTHTDSVSTPPSRRPNIFSVVAKVR